MIKNNGTVGNRARHLRVCKKRHHKYLRTSEKTARTHCSALLECCLEYNLLKNLLIKMKMTKKYNAQFSAVVNRIYVFRKLYPDRPSQTFF